MSKARYTPTENGFSINGSSELFNRTLYGSHKNDDKSARFFTFAGDAPQFMGATTDWEKNLVSFYAKCGTLISGLALTPGQRIGFFYSDDMDISSRWFHNSEDVAAEFKNGCMEYDLTQMSPWFPDVNVHIETYPLLPDDGFLVRYKISTDQRVIFTAGFGGLTDYIGRFEYKDEKKRYFHASDCVDNVVELGQNCAAIRHTNGCSMRIATSFDADFQMGSAKSLEAPYPSMFLSSTPEDPNDQVVKISAVIEPGKELDGYILVLHNSEEETLHQWLAMKDPVRYIKRQIYAKHACISVKTPDHPLDLTVAPTVIALDSSYHKNSFHHGAFGYHSPFLGWRNWYAPTVLGWKDRVETTMAAHLGQMIKHADGKERVWFDGGNPREGDGPSQYHSIENSTGYLPYLLGETMAYYNMQECALDMMLHHIEWTSDLDLARKYFDEFCEMLDWEERIFDPDNDGLYQNFLNTWISDGHAYNGAGCAQASAYNYRANFAMAKIAKKLGVAHEVFERRAEKIKNAIQEKLWLAHAGVIAESVDTVGNKLIHPSPELSTAYLAIDCDVVNDLQAYTMLKYTENHIKSIETPERKGRLSYCSNWLPKKYSTYGIFPAENAHLALVYFKLGLKEEGNRILNGLVDCYFTGRNPGMAAHVQSSRGTADLADLDFTDVSGTYLRLMVEGLFGVRINALDDLITIAPNFPEAWDHATLTLKDLALHYTKHGKEDIFDICCDRNEKKLLKLPMTSDSVEAMLLDGEPIPYQIVPAPNNSFVTVETDKIGRFQLRVIHGANPLQILTYAKLTVAGSDVAFRVYGGEIVDVTDISETLENIQIVNDTVYATTKRIAGKHTLFIRVKQNEYDAYLSADYELVEVEKETKKAPLGDGVFHPIDITNFFNCNMKELHDRQYMSPRPEGYSIGVFPNGRYAWEWNHRGHNQVYIDDSALRASGGLIRTPSGIPFLTPTEKENIACASVWDNFPTALTLPLNGNAKELAILFICTTNSMQTGVENVRITVEYEDGNAERVKLVYPSNVDDWLVPALQTENEIFYFNDYNHATVQRIRLDPDKKLACVKIEAIANEVIMGIMGVSIRR
ncbi:MAG: hypothetical protein IJX87_01625 [Clostridia bacterium]|nr:hypothetical protein [Clostridia bacterium]